MSQQNTQIYMWEIWSNEIWSYLVYEKKIGKITD